MKITWGLNNRIVLYFPALLTGVCLTMSFPNTGLFMIAWVALIPLMISVSTQTPRQAFFSGLCAGMVHYLSLIYWLVQTLEVYGGLHWVLAYACLVLLSFYLALYLGVFCALFRKLNTGGALIPLAGASFWVVLEYIRTYLLTGFPWGALGYSQYMNLNFIQIADFSGVYGVSFLIVLVNLTGVMAWKWIVGVNTNRDPLVGKQKMVLSVGITLSLLWGTYGYGRIQIKQVAEHIQKSPKVPVAVVQGNIRQDLKWTQSFRESTIEKYIKLSTQILDRQPVLVIWPETAMPFYYNYDNALSNLVDAGIRQANTDFLIGSPAVEVQNDEVKIYNRAYMLDRFSLITGIYDKIHLVPFGEYVPFEKYLTFLGKITAQAGNFSFGQKKYEPLVFKSHKTGVLICFDVLFPRIAARFVKNGADLLTTMTNDAWFGYSSATWQHFSICVFRAIENRRSVARAANTGISGFIDPKGKILKTTRLFTDVSIVEPISMLTIKTPYTKYGDGFAMICVLAICLAFVINRYLITAGDKKS